jgi:hypothetical protein
VTVSLFAGTPPPGLSLVAGQITGTPTSTGSYPITLRASNSDGYADLTVTITVSLPAYAVTFDPAGGTPDPLDQSVTQGQLATEPTPPTLTAQVFDGWWNGAVQWNFATDVVTAPVALTAHWLALPTISGPASADLPLDVAFTWTPTITAASGFVVTSTTLPQGLVMLDPSTGVISGAPTGALGTTVVTVTVTDRAGTDTTDVALTVSHGAALTVTLTPSDATPTQGDTITVTTEATDAHGNTWDATADAVITSSMASDVIVGDQVTFPHASPHRLTATVGAASGSTVVQVTAAASILGLTGASVGWLPVGALGAVLLGAGFLVVRRRVGL